MRELELQVRDFCQGAYDSEINGGRWKEILNYYLSNSNELEFNREKIHLLWTVNGGNLRCKVREDGLIADVLGRALPRYVGESMTLYRGECRFLYEANSIGFCWTPEKAVAETFARGRNAVESGGVVLRTIADSSAILCSPNHHSSIQMQEHEYTCDPRLLCHIDVLEFTERLAP